MKYLISGLALGLALSPAGFAQDAADTTADQAMVDAYMAAYSAADFDAMEPYMAEDVVFLDPTATGMGDAGLAHHSRADIMAALREFSERNNPIGLNFEWDLSYESNNRYVFVGSVNATYPTQEAGTLFVWSAPQTTVIHVRDGQVVEQWDIVDYEGARQELIPAGSADQ